MQQPRRSHRTTLAVGLMIGASLGIIEYTIIRGFGSAGLIINFVVLLCLAGFRGYQTSAKTGKVGSGALVGFLIGLISSVVLSVIVVIYVLVNVDALRQYLQQIDNNLNQGITYTNSLVIGSVVLLLVIVAVVSCLIGWGAGAIGGAISKRRTPAPPFPPQYQGAIYIPPPPYPPQGYAPLLQNTPQGYVSPPTYPPPGASEYIPPQ